AVQGETEGANLCRIAVLHDRNKDLIVREILKTGVNRMAVDQHILFVDDNRGDLPEFFEQRPQFSMLVSVMDPSMTHIRLDLANRPIGCFDAVTIHWQNTGLR